MQYKDIHLVLPTHPHYRAWVDNIRQLKSERERTDPFAAAYTIALYKWESVVQHILTTTVTHTHPTCPERILTYTTPNQQGRWRKQYRELDYVAGDKRDPQFIVEIKLQEKGYASMRGSRGWSQLNKASTITQHIWPNLRTFCINVAMGQILRIEENARTRATTIPELPQIFAQTDKQPTIWINGQEVAQYGTDNGLLTTEDIDNLASLRSEMLNPLQLLDDQPEPTRTNWINL